MLRKPTPLQSEKLPIIPDELAEALQAAPDGTSPKSTRPGLENGQKRAGLKNQLTRFRNVPTPATDHGHTAGHAALAVPKSPVPRDGAAAPASMRLPDIPSSPLNMGRVAAASRTSGSISSFELPNPRRASSAQESLASSTRSATRPAPIAPTVVPRDKAAAMEGPPSVAASGERLSGSRSDSSMQGLAFAPRDLPQERQRRSRASRSPEGRRRLGPSASFPPPSPYTTGSGLSPIDSALLEDSDPLAVINSRGAGRAPSPRPRDLPVPVSDTHALPAAGVRLGRTRASSLCRSTSDFSPLHPEPAERQSRRGRLRSSASAENLARLRPRPTPRRKQSGHVSDEDLDEIGQCQPEDEGRSSIYGDALADIHAEERMAASVLDRGGRHEAWRSEPATPAAGSEDGDETCWDDEEGPGWPRHEVFVHRLAERPRRSKHRRLSAASDSDSTSSADASPPGGPDRQHEQFEDAPADVGRQKTLRRPAVAADMTRTSTELTPATLRYMAWTHAEELEKASRLAKGSGPARASSRRRPSDRLVHFVTDRLRSRSMSESDISRPSAAAIGLEDEQDPPTRRAEEQLDAERHAFAAVRHEEAQANATDRAEFTIAVVGPRGVGKSTIVRTAFGLSHAKPRVLQSDGVNMVTSTRVSGFSGGRTRGIDVLEVDLALLGGSAIRGTEGLVWPEAWPPIDGIFICYHAGIPGGLEQVRLLMHAIWRRGTLYAIIFACRASQVEAENGVDPVRAAGTINSYGLNMIVLDGGVTDPAGKSRSGFSWMLRDIRTGRGESRSQSRSSYSTDLMARLAGSSRSTSPAQQTVGAVSRARPSASIDGCQAGPASFLDLSPDPNTASSSEGSPVPFEAIRRPAAVDDEVTLGLAITGVDPLANKITPAETPKPRSHGPKGHESSRTPQRMAEGVDLCLESQVLVDKFIFAAVTGNDTPFVDAFLIIFRRFVAPSDVLSTFVSRFDLAASNMQQTVALSRFVQIKICHLLLVWAETYPGDFVDAYTFARVQDFGRRLVEQTWTLALGVELKALLKIVPHIHDPEVDWSLPPSPGASVSRPVRRALEPPIRPVNASPDQRRGSEVPDGRAVPISPRVSLRNRSGSDARSLPDSRPRSHVSTQSGGKDLEQALLDCSTALLAMPEDAIALQITRLQWDIFSEMKPRDLIRHVLAPRDPSNPHLSLRANSPVSRSTDLFNHLSAWTTSMILAHARLKSRAKALLKFMKVAWVLRDMEDFHSLMAVLAGIEMQPVHRLTGTFEAADNLEPIAYRRYRSLTRLMSSSRAHHAYKLARRSAGHQSLPYVGVHLQEITAINEVKNDMRNGKVNWTKASLLSKAASCVSLCQRFAPELPVDEKIERLIMNGPVLDEDGLYELSHKLKPRNGEGKTGRLRHLLSTAISELNER